MTSTNESKIILTDSSKWEEWDRAFKVYLRGLNLMGFLDGSKIEPEEPQIPQARDFLTRQQRDAAVDLDSQQTDDTFGGASPPPLRNVKLTKVQAKAYLDALILHSLEYEIYDRYMKQYDGIRKWMRKTIRREYAILALDDDTKIPKMYENLKRLAGPYDADIKTKIYDEYRTGLACNIERRS